MIKTSFTTLGALIFCTGVSGQQPGAPDGYDVVNRHFSIDTAEHSIHLDEADNSGIAWIKGVGFTEGTIEFDEKGRDVQQRSFVGFCFHGSDDTTYEAIYFRPFNFRSPDSAKKTHMVEYIAMPQYDWPKLRTGFPGVYEHGVSPVPDPNDWFHVKIAVTGEKISVFVNGSASPSLVVTPLVHRPGKRVGFWVGNGAPGDWRNLRIRVGAR
jgi:hypothetical protein